MVLELCGTQYSDDVAEEIDSMITEMTRPKGLCHFAMANGFAMCSAAITRKVHNSDGVPMILKGTGRFVAHDEAVVMQYRIAPAVARQMNGMIALSEMSADAQLRNPRIAALMGNQVRRLHQTMQMQLPMPKKEEDGA
jgi:hypothetical protein